LIVDDVLAYGAKFKIDGDKLISGKDEYHKVEVKEPSDIPAHWKGLIGEYGWDHNILYILEKDGKLYCLIEWVFLYPLKEINQNVYAFPDFGLYHGEKLIFSRNADGNATEVEAANVVFNRRKVQGEDGSTYKIRPNRMMDAIRKEAMNATPPREEGEFRAPDLVDLSPLDPTILLDIRYATENNFLGTTLYSTAKAFLQRPAADALLRAHKKLAAKGYGLLIHDAYRPWFVTKIFYEATPDYLRNFVADPSKGSRHNRGCAVDLTLYDLKTGKPVQMVSGFDEFSDRSFPDYVGGTSKQRWLRDLLRSAMQNEGFTVYDDEWWHFDYKDWKSYPIINLPFEEIGKK